jgi:hypothetical protein
MNSPKNFRLGWATAAACLLVLSMAGANSARAQGEKRTVFTEQDFHWQGQMKAGQTLEVINQNGEIEGQGASGDEARAEGIRRGSDDDHELFIEVVEYSDGVTICAVQAKDNKPGRCHRGGVSSESWSGWHSHHASINFNLQVPRGVNFHAKATNGNVRCHGLESVVEATTTNGNVDVSTSEWAEASTTNGGVHVSIGNAKWTGELRLRTTNGSVEVTMPASADFRLDASTTNGGVHTDFPITVQGSLSSKELSGTVGSGGRELKVATTNGSIRLMKS